MVGAVSQDSLCGSLINGGQYNLNSVTGNRAATNPVIFGQITDGNNVGVANVAVTLSGVRSQVISTDANGYYLFENLLSGFNYSVIPNSPYYAFTPKRADIANLPPNGQTQNFTIQAGAVPTGGPVIDDDFNTSTVNLNKWNVGLLTQTAGFTPQQVGGRQCVERLCSNLQAEAVMPTAGTSELTIKT
jgi:hypothetical protein